MVTVILALFLASLVLGSLDLTAVAQTSVTQTTTGHPLPAPGKVIVVLRDDIVTAASDDIAASASVDPTYVYDHVLDGFAATVSAAELQALAKNPAVDFISPDLPVHAFAQTLPTQITRTGIATYPPAAINGDNSVVDIDLGILDTGVDASHPDLNVAGGFACIDPDGTVPATNPANYADGNGHGTHVAGIAAARDNDLGIVGAAPGARIWAVKVLDDRGNGTTSSIICGLDVVFDNGGAMDVVNMSLGGRVGSTSTCANEAMHAAVCRAVDRGTTVVVAAGNDGIDARLTVPAFFDEAIAVGAINDYDGVPGSAAAPTCTNWGADDAYAGYSNFGTVVDIAAPGTCVNSTLPGGGYGTKSGTSMASPLVAGLAALHRSQGGGDVRSWLLSDAVSVPQSSPVGWSPPAASGSPNRLLYLGSASPGTLNPSFSGTRLPISTATSAPDRGLAPRAIDNNTSTDWYCNYCPGSTLTLDLGSDRAVSGVKWKISWPPNADNFSVRVRTAGGVTTELGQFGNPPTAQTWYGVTSTATGRYIDFVFTNPNSDAGIGSVSEVEIWGVGSPSTPGTLNPSFSGTRLPISTATSAPDRGLAPRAIDNNTTTDW
jgi:subtilisin family serine protease